MSESGYLNSRQAQKKIKHKNCELATNYLKRRLFASIARLDGKSFGSHGFDGRIMSENVTWWDIPPRTNPSPMWQCAHALLNDALSGSGGRRRRPFWTHSTQMAFPRKQNKMFAHNIDRQLLDLYLRLKNWFLRKFWSKIMYYALFSVAWNTYLNPVKSPIFCGNP